MAETIERPFKFDLERAKKTINSVIGDVIDADKISKAIDHFMKEHDDIKTADDVLYYFKWQPAELSKVIGISDTEKNQIITNIEKYEFSEQRIEDGKADDEYEERLKNAAASGGSRKRHTRKYAIKHRKSARRGTKQRKSSRRQLPLRRRRTNKK